MELFEQLRSEFERGVGTVQGVARKFGVHRRQVRQALSSVVATPILSAPNTAPIRLP